MKETAMKERIERVIAEKKLKKNSEELRVGEEPAEKNQKLVSSQVVNQLAETMETSEAVKTADLVCGMPRAASPATVAGTMMQIKITKPQPPHRRVAAEAHSHLKSLGIKKLRD